MALESLKGDVAAQLPEWKAELERFARFIEAAEALVGAADTPDSEGRPAPSPRRHHAGQPGTIRPDEFVGMSTSKAITAFLTIMGKGHPQGPREMARAFVQGGRESDEDKAYANVTATLKRMKKQGDVKQVRRGQWGLASWYGNSAPTKKEE